MNVAVVLITHNKIGTSMVEVASSIVNHKPVNLACVEIPMDASVDSMEEKVTDIISKMNKQDGVLILTDMYGSTPSNIANRFAIMENVMLVSGLNLPMLIRIMNYRTLSINELLEKALEGGQDGIAIYEHGII